MNILAIIIAGVYLISTCAVSIWFFCFFAKGRENMFEAIYLALAAATAANLGIPCLLIQPLYILRSLGEPGRDEITGMFAYKVLSYLMVGGFCIGVVAIATSVPYFVGRGIRDRISKKKRPDENKPQYEDGEDHEQQ